MDQSSQPIEYSKKTHPLLRMGLLVLSLRNLPMRGSQFFCTPQELNPTVNRCLPGRLQAI
jgi:hypothetical protein